MPSYRVIAIPQSTADAVRATGRSPRYGHPAHTELAKGYGPCRLCLRFFDEGAERRTLFTYDAFQGFDPLPMPGPVFVHADECERYDEHAGFPAHLDTHRLTLIAYGEGRRQLAEEHVGEDGAQPLIDRLLAIPGVRYLHVRDTDAGCYDCAIVPA